MHVRDRLEELKSKSGSVNNESVEIGFAINTNNDEKLQAIFKEMEKIRSWINEINEKTTAMKKLYSETIFQASKQMQDEMESIMVVCTATGFKISGALKEFNGRMNDFDPNSATYRIVNILYTSAQIMYSEALDNHEGFLKKYRDSRMTLLQQQIKLTNQSITEEECHNLLDSNNLTIFVDNIEADTREAKLALQDVEYRHKEIIKVENAIKHVRDMFLHMATLVNQQQDLINTVEYYASQASGHVDNGTQQIHKGLQNKIKANRKKISLIICLLCGLFLFLVILIVF